MDLKLKSKQQLKKIVESLDLTLEKKIEDFTKVELIALIEKTSIVEPSQPIISSNVEIEISPLEKRKWSEYIKRCGLTPKEFLILYPNHPAEIIIKSL